VEFDYATVHAVWALSEAGFETVMINSNPETVSTDYDTADRLYFEPLTFEDVLNVIEHEKPKGVIVQLGGQTPLKLAQGLADAGVPIWGTSPAAIHAAEDRDEFHALCERLGIAQPVGGVAADMADVQRLAHEIGYPVMIRPSYVLGGRAMKVVWSDEELEHYLREVYAEVPGRPSILVDDFIEGAKEVDVDAISDGETTVVAGIMEHIEGAGVHSGDSACITPPVTLSPQVISTITEYTVKLAEAIGVRGLVNIQYLIRADEVLVIEANPRASRTIPYLSKAIGHPLAKYAALVSAGSSLKDIGFTSAPHPAFYSAKEVTLPFLKFRSILPVLGPEMRSTGESMGIAFDPYLAYYKAQLAAGVKLPDSGSVLLIGDDLAEVADSFVELGFVVQTCDPASRPENVEFLLEYDLLVDTVHTHELRRALEAATPYVTTRSAAEWTAQAIRTARNALTTVHALQDLHEG
jgi:carbamoyl-phosphate synthase large subunit